MITHKTHRGPGIKEWRLVLRNLPFDTSEEEIREMASQHGIIKELKLPKCKDQRFPNSCAGFCFIQYARRCDAEKFQKEQNFSMFKNRKISVDWAMDKDSYVTMTHQGKSEMRDFNIKTEAFEIKKEEPDDEISEDHVFDYKNFEVKMEESSDDNCSKEQCSISDTKTQAKNKLNPNKKTKRDDDPAVKEGRVVFLRNVPFDATDADVCSTASKFGEVALSILCKYPDTGLPNGSAFVHFKEKEAADCFLEQLLTEEGVVVLDRKVYGHRAVLRQEAEGFKKQDQKMGKDKRNLYLLRASFIRPGTVQAKDMSDTDSQLRTRLMLNAKNKLKSLLMYVSPNRLVVHNLPFSYNDEQLRKVCTNVTKCDSSAITECRIMKQKKGEDAKGHLIFGKSKGFAFVCFKNHATALLCLQKMNNNSEIFTNERRPIVEFSIESLKAVRIKEKRFNKSLRHQDDPELTKTKQMFMTGGKKWLPKKLGIKIRSADKHHRNMSNTKSRKIKHGKIAKRK